jgi:hypothetical protein
MKTTINIDNNLLLRAKRYALESGNTLTRLIEEGLNNLLKHVHLIKTSGYKLKWKTFKGSILPGVDISDRDSLFNKMEGKD